MVDARENRGAPVAKGGGLELNGCGLQAVVDAAADDGAPVAMAGGLQSVGADRLEEAQPQYEVDLEACTPVGTAAGGRPRTAVRGEASEVRGEVRDENVVTVEVLDDGAPCGAVVGGWAALPRGYARGEDSFRVGGREQGGHSALLVSLLYSEVGCHVV